MQPKDDTDWLHVNGDATYCETDEYRFGDFSLHPRLFALRRNGQQVDVTRQAFEVLRYLIEHRNRVVSHRELFDRLWVGRRVSDNALNQAIAAARRAIGDDGSGRRSIETVYGRGFRFVAALEVGPVLESQGAISLRGAASLDRTLADAELERLHLAGAFGTILSDLFGDLRELRLFGTARRGGEPDEVSICSVYTGLELTQEVTLAHHAHVPAKIELVPEEALGLAARIGPELQQDLQLEAACRPKSVRRRHRRKIRAIEAAALCARLVVLGPPGSGKSTFLRHLGLCLAGSILARAEAGVERLRARPAGAAAWMPWEQRACFPIFVELGDFVASEAFPPPRSAGTSSHLFAYLALRAGGGSRAAQYDALEHYLQPREGEGSLLLLDGLDEIRVADTASAERDPEGTRDRLTQVIRSFVHRFPKARVILTSRPHAYEPGSPWRLDALGFESAGLAPFSDENVRVFCHNWYAAIAARGTIGSDHAEQRALALVAQLGVRLELRGLTERPLTLAMLAELHTRYGALPQGRAALYEESASLFLDRWNAARETGHVADNRLTVKLNIGLPALRAAVEHLAYEGHRASSSPNPTLFSAGQVIDVLFEHGAKGEAERILDFLSERSGILFADSRYHYRFAHRSYQEYLAACHLTKRDFPEQLVAEVRRDPQRFREVIPLALSRLHSAPRLGAQWIASLLDPESAGSDGARHLLAGLCAEGMLEAGLRQTIEAKDPTLYERLRALLLEAVCKGSAPERDRVHAAELLGQLGDPRVAQLERVMVAGGSFAMGAQRQAPDRPYYDPAAWDREGPVHDVKLSPFALTRYPVTVCQFAEFIADGGYEEHRCWNREGWALRQTHDFRCPTRWTDQLLHPNRPVVGVSWYEAAAFARWAGGCLPSEAQWEYVARGGAHWRYPWGDEPPSEEHAAFGERFSHPVPVGTYPRGKDNPFHVYDLAGNVYEYCRDSATVRYDPEPQADPVHRRQGWPAIVRGGWYAASAPWIASARRSSVSLHSRDHDVTGFRVAWAQ